MATSPPTVPPPQAQKPRSKAGCILGCLGVGAALMVAFFVWLAYAVYHSQTPEGQREIAESHRKDQQAIEAFVAKVQRIGTLLPRHGTPDSNCPAGTRAKLAPLVDTLYLTTVVNDLDPKDRAERLAKSKLLRDGISFPEAIPEAVRDNRHAEEAGFGATWGVSSMKQLEEQPVVVILRVDGFDRPQANQDGSFVPGSVTGSAVVVDWKGERVLCQGAFQAKSSDQITYGGGVRLKVGGIPMPAVGGSDAQEALDKDLRENASSAIGKALARIGAG